MGQVRHGMKHVISLFPDNAPRRHSAKLDRIA